MIPHRSNAIVLLAVAFAAGACDAAEPVSAAAPLSLAVASAGSAGFKFDPLTSSAVCVANGSGDRFDLPAGYSQTILTRQSGIAALVGGSGEDLFDMTTLNETGPFAGRYLYRTHEVGSNGAVTRTDLWTGATVLISQNTGHRRLDGIAWTPWHTLLFAEETTGGRIFEYFPGANTVVDRGNVGLRSHEGLRIDPQGDVYGISETSPGYVFKFVPDVRGDLSSGRHYALKVADADRTGAAT